ncbi:PHP domain-containing protein [Tautonia sociabilis]|uniref:PHP domain-containing protein n=1 Tax=Tautonia sociabilis TaxID=2080755 RepID=A0A432MI04_9BACT|nr:hypothetical protein [Tautonia sociabilis]RUL86959.1 hypothetical protein TsocGM_15065 [Tautonia sociabilis]
MLSRTNLPRLRWRWLAPLALLLLPRGGALGSEEEGPAVPADPPARWWKGNLHTHSFWSDGNDFPEMIVDWYRQRGYHFLALSDHNVLSQGPRWMDRAEIDRRSGGRAFDRYVARFGRSWVETRTVDGTDQVRLRPLSEYRALVEQADRFLLIQGEEITDRFERKPIHMNASNLAELVPPQGGSSVVEVIENNLKAVQEQAERLGIPIVTHLNHPNFGYGVTAEELAEAVRERFFEVYNGHPGVNHQGDTRHAPIERMWDIANTLRIAGFQAAPLFGLGTDDSHNYFGTEGSSPGRGWIMVRSRHLTPERLIDAIQAGDFYASSGVTLREVRYDEAAGALELEVEPEEGASYRIDFIGTLNGAGTASEPVLDDEGTPIDATRRYSDEIGKVLASAEGTSARYELTGDELYVRAVVTSSLPPENPSFAGQKAQAWTQPVGWSKWVEAANPAAGVGGEGGR